MATNAAPIIIKRKKGGGHGGHHGGAWKVAYADFVTAMMAFFLLLWLLNSTTQQQRSGISEYFSPASVARTTSGAGGVLGGQTITLDGPQKGKGAPLGLPTPMPEQKVKEDPEEDSRDRVDAGPANRRPDEAAGAGKNPKGEAESETDEAAKALLRRREDQLFDAAEQAIKRSLETLPGLRRLSENLIIDRTPEGMRVQIVDRARTAMFASGSSVPYQHTRQLLEVVAKVVARLPNKLTVTGHTDATPYARGASYSNWELSADRANASRRELRRFGVPTARFARVTGKAATEPLIAADPKNPRNRRIAITLLRQTNLPPRAAGPAPERRAVPPPPVVKGAKAPKLVPEREPALP